MTDMAETSLQAFRQKLEDGSELTDRQRCFKIIDEYGPITSSEMERHMGKSKYSFSGRINKLKNMGLVEVTGTRDGHQVLEVSEERNSGKEFVDPGEISDLDNDDVDDLFIDTGSDDNGSEELEAGDLIWG